MHAYCGSIASVCDCPSHVCFDSDRGQITDAVASPFRAKPEVVLTDRINSPVSGPRATWRGDFSRGLVYFIPINSGVEARPYIPDIRVETYLRRGSGPACENGLRWNPPCPIQLVGEGAPTLSLYFERSHATTRHRSDLRTAYGSPTHLTCSTCERFCAAGAKNSLTSRQSLNARRRCCGDARLTSLAPTCRPLRQTTL
jgi:hypothetical protein